MPLHTRTDMWFVQDDTPFHSTNAVQGHLTSCFGNRWVNFIFLRDYENAIYIIQYVRKCEASSAWCRRVLAFVVDSTEQAKTFEDTIN
jgi:hypothetical protein